MKAPENQLLILLQKGLPLAARPFAELGQAVGWTEEQVVGFVENLFRSGTARRLGAVFDARRLGYRSVLCAIATRDPRRLPELANILAPHPGITHCYERGWPNELDPRSAGGPGPDKLPDLWFTLSALRSTFDSAVHELQERAAPDEVLLFPARQRFKIEVVFDPASQHRTARCPAAAGVPDPEEPGEPAAEPQTEAQRQIVRLLQGNVPVKADFFAETARQMAMSVDHLLEQLRQWQAAGVLRRIGVILRHQHIGFTANAMCVWSVAPARVAAAGRALAAFAEVTHCYERATTAAFGYNLFAMIHTAAWTDTQRLFVRLSDEAGLTNGRMLCSLREFKKSSMVFFK